MTERRYRWRGHDRQGKGVQGEMHADSKTTVIQALRTQRIRATQVQRQFDVSAWLAHTQYTRVKPSDITRFTRQLALLLHTGVPLLQALSVLEQSEPPSALKTLIQNIAQQIEGGTALHQALQTHAAFDVLYCSLVAVGELTGALDATLDELSQHLEKAQALRSTLRSALIYPSAVLGIASVVLVLILVWVVPAFETLFANFGAELPWLTQQVLHASTWGQSSGPWVLLILLAIGVWFKREVAKRPHWQRVWHTLVLRLPVAGPLTQQACTARWARTLATLFAAGVPLTEAHDAVQGVSGNQLFQNAPQRVQAQLMQGQSLATALHSNAEVFPRMLVQMCAIGEESGALDTMLDKTASHYEQEVDRTVARLSTLLEPFIMVVLGVLVGGLVMALYLPIFQMGQAT